MPGAPVLWPWLRVLRGWAGAEALPSAAQGEPDAVARFRLFSAIAEALAARAGDAGLLVVLGDMHWADRMSMLLLRHLAARLATERLGVLVTYRDGAAGPLLETIGELMRGDHSQALALHGLTVEDVTRWLPELTGSSDRGLATALHRRTGGNPLLVRLVAGDLAQRETRADPSAHHEARWPG